MSASIQSNALGSNLLIAYRSVSKKCCLCCFTLFQQTPIDQNSDKTILDAGFEPGKKNFLHLTDKDGEQPHVMQVKSLLSYISQCCGRGVYSL